MSRHRLRELDGDYCVSAHAVLTDAARDLSRVIGALDWLVETGEVSSSAATFARLRASQAYIDVVNVVERIEAAVSQEELEPISLEPELEPISLG